MKGIKKKSKVHQKVIVKIAFYFYNVICQSYLSFSWSERDWNTLFYLYTFVSIVLYGFVKNTCLSFLCVIAKSLFFVMKRCTYLAELYSLHLKAIDVSIGAKNFFLFSFFCFVAPDNCLGALFVLMFYVHM